MTTVVDPINDRTTADSATDLTDASSWDREQSVRVDYRELVSFAAEVFTARGLSPERSAKAAAALVHGDLTGVTSHGLTNLTRLYLPLLDEGRADPAADLEVVADRGAAVLVDSHNALGLWSAGAAMDLALERAEEHGIGLVSLYNGTHFGCAGHFTGLVAEAGAIALLAGNCGGQRIIRPPGGAVPLLGTNPFSIASPGGEHPPYVLDMSTSVVPTGRVRQAARAGQQIPEGWLVDDHGAPVTDPAAFDRGEAHLAWLGGTPENGAFKGYGLSLMVETLAALLPGAGLGPTAGALADPGSGRDDNIGFCALVIAPGRLRDPERFQQDAAGLFGTLLASPSVNPDVPVSYPGVPEYHRAARHRADGVPLAPALYAELADLAGTLNLTSPALLGGTR